MAVPACPSCRATTAVAARFCSACGCPLEGGSLAHVGMVPAAGAAAPAAFDACRPPVPGSLVPVDCVWARHPHPGAYRGARLHGNVLQKLSALGPLAGRTHQEITGHVGDASHEQELPGGGCDITWEGTDYWSSRTVRETLRFDRYGVCAGTVDHEGGGVDAGVLVGAEI